MNWQFRFESQEQRATHPGTWHYSVVPEILVSKHCSKGPSKHQC